MVSPRHPWLASALAISVRIAAAQSQTPVTFPTTVEVDLVFPRNDSFAPGQYLPIVFAIQNARAAPGLLFQLNAALYRDGANGTSTFIGNQGLTRTNYSTTSGTEPYFVVLTTNITNSTEGRFGLLWEVMTTNCSATLVEDQSPHNPTAQLSRFSNVTWFTLRNDARPPSLVTTPESCPVSMKAFNVSSTVPVQREPGNSWEDPVCAVLGDTPPQPSPCAVKIDSTVASSLSAVISATACANMNTVRGVGCPDAKKSDSGKRVASGWRTWLGLTTGMLFGPFLIGLWD